MQLWFACKSLANNLCVEARLLTQIFDISSQLLTVPPLAIYTTAACLLPDAILFQLYSLASSRRPTHLYMSVRLRGALLVQQVKGRIAFTFCEQNCVNR